MTEVEVYPGSKSPRRGTLVEEGPEQSTIRITSGQQAGQLLCLPNGHWRRLSEGKNAGPRSRREYARPTGGKTKERPMADEEGETTQASATNYVEQYNGLVEEAREIGLNGYKPISTRFRDEATGAKRCEALAEAIEAHRAKVEGEAAQPPSEEVVEPSPPENQEKKKMPKTSAKKKAKAAPAKKAAKAAPKPVVEKVRTGIVGEFGTREGTHRENVLLALYAKKNKAVSLTDLAKTVYGKGDHENRMKVKAVIVGLNMMIEEGKLPYKPVEYEGRAEEATVMLASKSGR